MAPLLNKFKRLFRRAICYIFIAFISLIIINVFGLLVYPFELSYEKEFQFDIEMDNFPDFVTSYQKGLNPNNVRPLNEYAYEFMINSEDKCRGERHMNFRRIHLLMIVKSAINHTDRRAAIRKTWGMENRFANESIRRVFILGSCKKLTENHQSKSVMNNCQNEIEKEAKENLDIVQADFLDTYYNNTIKSMMALKWALNYCSDAQHIYYVDDDYYVSPKNLLQFINETQNLDHLLFGYVFSYSRPKRDKFSKWQVSLKEYPFSRYPPYIHGGSMLMARKSLGDLYVASLFTKKYRFDDIYLGILAKKLTLLLIHNPNFHFTRPDNFEKVISSHGFDDPKEMMTLWQEQSLLGNV